ncbi:RagB/SusD family nutrient uptake outer membrane protein [Parabacteroides pacaensis]|uniref:RagB/SusD family nutrient uptake outer membrane protein n=1 Tax=Parabacteroides pacaensis TaxID=2086575 RepID=UPI000D11473C|nr:RagB/SusD family nutrient uptake outer membrane protein [Parabacteroides pacaensis]
MKRIINLLLIAFLSPILCGCDDYLDIVPDNVATIENAFAMRSTAERYLFTCYSYLPAEGTFGSNIALSAGDEFWLPGTRTENAWYIARGYQNVADPYMNFWQGNRGGKDLYEGIRQCNVFIENIVKVPDMEEDEKNRWTAEAKFLKAYYHFYLVRMYGPIPLIKENVPVDADRSTIYPYRNTIDDCFNYITELLDEAIPYLPAKIENEISELGRLTQIAGYSFKAVVLVTAASPFFNGNNDYANMRNTQGEMLFNQDKSMQKWEDAAEACRLAIEACEKEGYRLYKFAPDFFQYDISDTIRTQLSIRNSLNEKWNSEIIWGNTNNMAISIQKAATPRGLDPSKTANSATEGYIAPPIKIAEMFYSDKGVPISEDKTYDYAGRWDLKIGDAASNLYIKEGYTTVKLHFNREPRFYADLGFDGGIWYGQGRFDDKSDLFYVSCKKGQPATAQNQSSYSVTGYWPKKLVNFNNVIGSGTTYTIESYPWPLIRLSNLYLLYAEALNEIKDHPDSEVYKWINAVRERAGLQSVESSWEAFSTNPQKYKDKEGMRAIIQQERLIELAFEGQRFWDLRRWKLCMEEFNKPIKGWDLEQEDAPSYYRQKVIFNQQFTTRDYLWPIRENELLSNKNIKQNPGW